MLEIGSADEQALAIGVLLMLGGLLGHLARRRGLSPVPGYLVAGLVAGALFGVPSANSTAAFGALPLLAAGYALFVVGASLPLSRRDVRAIAVFVPISLVAIAGVCAAVLPVASAIASTLGTPLPALPFRGALLLALLLTTASPSIVAWVCTDHVHHQSVRRAIATVVALDACIILLVAGFDAVAGFDTTQISSTLPSPLDLLPAAVLGLGLAVVVARRPGPSSLALATIVLALVLVVGRSASLPIAVLASSLFVGIAVANVAPDAARRVVHGRAVFCVAVALALGCTAATVDITDVVVWLVPALVLVSARWLAAAVATRVCTIVAPAHAPSPLAGAALLPQAGLAVLLLDGAHDLAQPLAPFRGLVVAVVLVDALVMSALLCRRAVRLLEHGGGLPVDVAANATEEPRGDVGAVRSFVFPIEHEASQPDLRLGVGLVADQYDSRGASRRSVWAERSGGPSEAQGVFGLHARRDRQHDLARGIADGEVESHDVLAREARVRDRDLGAVDRTQHHGARRDGGEAPLDVSDAQIVADAVAVLDAEHDGVKDVAKPW